MAGGAKLEQGSSRSDLALAEITARCKMQRYGLDEMQQYPIGTQRGYLGGVSNGATGMPTVMLELDANSLLPVQSNAS